jgi:hypothetical protein
MQSNKYAIPGLSELKTYSHVVPPLQEEGRAEMDAIFSKSVINGVCHLTGIVKLRKIWSIEPQEATSESSQRRDIWAQV